MKWVEADAQIRQVPGQAHPFKSGIKSPFCNRIICNSIENILGNAFSGCKVNNRHIAAVHAVAEQQDFKILRFCIFVNTTLGQVDAAVGFNINF